jgi:hypothetical protein
MSTHGITHLTEAQLSELVDGTLEEAERASAAWHLDMCEDCRRELAEARALLVLSQQARRALTAPPELWPLVAASTIHAARMRRRVLRSLRPVLLGGALALVLGTAAVTAFVVARLRPSPAATPPRGTPGDTRGVPSGATPGRPAPPPTAPAPPAVPLPQTAPSPAPGGPPPTAPSAPGAPRPPTPPRPAVETRLRGPRAPRSVAALSHGVRDRSDRSEHPISEQTRPS